MQIYKIYSVIYTKSLSELLSVTWQLNSESEFLMLEDGNKIESVFHLSLSNLITGPYSCLCFFSVQCFVK
jgi:hypothetical protein